MKKNITKGMIFAALFSFSFLSFSQTSAYAAEADASEAKNMLKNIVSKYSDMEEDAVSEHSNEYKVSTLVKLRATTDKTLEYPSAAQETSPKTISKEDNEDIKNADAAEKSVSGDKKEEEEKTPKTEAGTEMPVIENAGITETEAAASTATPTITVVKIAEKEIELMPGKEYSFKYIQDGSVGVFYIDDIAALTVRVYGVSGKPIRLFAENNSVMFSSLRQKTK